MNTQLRIALPALPVALQMLPAAQAQIIYTDVPDITLNAGYYGVISFDVNLDGGGNPARLSFFDGADFFLYLTAGDGLRPYLLNDLPNSAAGEAALWSGKLSRFDAGSTIGPELSFTGFGGVINNQGNNDANWPAGTVGFLGLRLRPDDETHFGWARIGYGSDLSLTLYDFAYNTIPDDPILAGETGRFTPVPEASSVWGGVGLILAGSAALYRRRRQQPKQGASADA